MVSRKRVLVALVMVGALFAIVLIGARRKPDSGRSIFTEHAIVTFGQVGLQMLLPKNTALREEGPRDLLVAFHPVSRGLLTEPVYSMEISISRISAEELQERTSWATNSHASAFNVWFHSSHFTVNEWDGGRYRYMRYDVPGPSNQYFRCHCKIESTSYLDDDVREARRILTSIKHVH